jgi:hypothetical protein
MKAMYLERITYPPQNARCCVDPSVRRRLATETRSSQIVVQDNSMVRIISPDLYEGGRRSAAVGSSPLCRPVSSTRHGRREICGRVNLFQPER